MKKIISTFLISTFLVFSPTNLKADESTRLKADAAAAGSFNATAWSMVFWGVVLVTSMALAAIFINSSGHQDSKS
ncbi:MAG: hypothetical protein K1060chlam5_00041 [Candidatus Anoxychlamydiales bacterium]|nr:hypothetical protein [Candidatus Anoxychlamydiales bacterium]